MIMPARTKDSGPQKTAVMVSMHSTKASCVWYRESESEYSFQSWPNRSCIAGMRRKLYAK